MKNLIILISLICGSSICLSSSCFAGKTEAHHLVYEYFIKKLEINSKVAPARKQTAEVIAAKIASSEDPDKAANSLIQEWEDFYQSGFNDGVARFIPKLYPSRKGNETLIKTTQGFPYLHSDQFKKYMFLMNQFASTPLFLPKEKTGEISPDQVILAQNAVAYRLALQLNESQTCQFGNAYNQLCEQEVDYEKAMEEALNAAIKTAGQLNSSEIGRITSQKDDSEFTLAPFSLKEIVSASARSDKEELLSGESSPIEDNSKTSTPSSRIGN